MTAPRNNKWTTIHGLVGGLAMFAAEALTVLGLGAVAWVLSVVVLAIL
jgi:hypothetical protein